MKRGDVVRVNLPPPAGPPGREQFGPRPAIIVQTDRDVLNNNIGNLSTTIVVPLTSNQGSLRFAGSILIKATAENGLDTDSVALSAQIRVIDRRRIQPNRMGKLGEDDLKVLEVQLRMLLSL